MIRRGILTLALAAWAVSGVRAGEGGFKDLFNGKDLTGWKTNVFGKDEGKTFFVQDGVIVVSGKPNGYFYTDKSYKNYVLKYDWKFIKDGNSGLLVHIQSHGKGWPKSLEIQGMQKQHGSIIGIGIKTTQKVNAEAQKKTIKIGDWNTTEMTIKDGEATTVINGVEVSVAKILNEDVKEGPLGFQSEGTELHFKNIKIKELPSSGAQKGASVTPKSVDEAVKKASATTTTKTPTTTTTTTTTTTSQTPTQVQIIEPAPRGLFPNLRQRIRLRRF